MCSPVADTTECTARLAERASDVQLQDVQPALEPVDGALLDVNLRGEMVFPAARILIARGVPVVFCSGYTSLRTIPAEFAAVPQVSKPYEPDLLIAALRSVLPLSSPRA